MLTSKKNVLYEFLESSISSCKTCSKSSNQKLEVSPLEGTKGTRFINDEPYFSFTTERIRADI